MKQSKWAVAFVFCAGILTPVPTEAELMTLTSADGREMEVFVLAVWSDEIMVVRRDKKEFSLKFDQLSADSLNLLSKAVAPQDGDDERLHVRLGITKEGEQVINTGETKTIKKSVPRVKFNGLVEMQTVREKVEVTHTVRTQGGYSVMFSNTGDELTPNGLIQWIVYSADGQPSSRGAKAMPALGGGAIHGFRIYDKETAGIVIRHYRPDLSEVIWEERDGDLPSDLQPDWTGIENETPQDPKRIVNGEERNSRRSTINHRTFRNPEYQNRRSLPSR